MLRLGGKPIVRIIVERVLRSGICTEDEITICVLGRYLDDFRHEFRDLPGIKFSPKPEAIGTATHYFYAAELEQCVGPEENVLVHYADCVTEIDYADLVRFSREYIDPVREDVKDMVPKPECFIAVTRQIKHDYSEVRLVGNSVIAFQEKPQLSWPTWTGIAIIRHGVLREMFRGMIFGRPVDFAANVFTALVKAGGLRAYEYNGLWFDVGNSIAYNKLIEKYNRGDLFA